MRRIISDIGRWINSNRLVLILVLIAFVILGCPLIIWGVEKSFFYSQDPDVVYITNTLLYAKSNIIVYTDHPGTPTILLLNYLYFPLRLIAKYIAHKDFIQWSFDNYAFLTYYSRVFQLIISLSGLTIFLSIIKKTTKSSILTINAFFSTFLFVGFTSILMIRPENFSFFLTACWLVVFTKFLDSKKYVWVAILAALSGFIFANKFTGLFLVILSILFPLFVNKEKFTTRLIMLQANIAIFLEFFLIGIWPVRNKITDIFGWGLHIFGHADIHGTGANSFVDWNSYALSLYSLVFGNRFLVIFIVLTIFLAMILLIKKKVKPNNPVILLIFISFLGILVFAKYPLIHYNFVNIFLIDYCAIYLLSKINPIWSRLTMLVIGTIFIISVYSNLTAVLNHPPQKVPGGVNAFLEYWTPFWSADIFKEQLNVLKISGS